MHEMCHMLPYIYMKLTIPVSRKIRETFGNLAVSEKNDVFSHFIDVETLC